MGKQIKLLLLLAMIIAFFSGCTAIECQITFEKDGKVTLSSSNKYSKATLRKLMGDQMENFDLYQNFKEKIDSDVQLDNENLAAEQAEAAEPVTELSAQVDKIDDDEYTGFFAEVTYDSPEQMLKAESAQSLIQFLPLSGRDGVTEEHQPINIVRTQNPLFKTYNLSGKVSIADIKANAAQMLPDENIGADASIEIKFAFTSPTIFVGNGVSTGLLNRSITYKATDENEILIDATVYEFNAVAIICSLLGLLIIIGAIVFALILAGKRKSQQETYSEYDQSTNEYAENYDPDSATESVYDTENGDFENNAEDKDDEYDEDDEDDAEDDEDDEDDEDEDEDQEDDDDK